MEKANAPYSQRQLLISYVTNPVTPSNHRKTDTVLALGRKYGRRCPSLRLGTRLLFHGSQCITSPKKVNWKLHYTYLCSSFRSQNDFFFLHNFWIHLCRTWVTFYLKFIVTGASERSILLCPNALCLNHIVTTTTLVPSSILTRRFSLQGVLCAASVRMSFLNIMSRITQEGRLNEQLSLLHRPVSMSVQDSLKKSTEIKKTQPTVGNTTL